jgi:hypothetical protein
MFKAIDIADIVVINFTAALYKSFSRYALVVAAVHAFAVAHSVSSLVAHSGVSDPQLAAYSDYFLESARVVISFGYELDAICQRVCHLLSDAALRIFGCRLRVFFSNPQRNLCLTYELSYTGSNSENLKRLIDNCSTVIASAISAKRSATVRAVAYIVFHVSSFGGSTTN